MAVTAPTSGARITNELKVRIQADDEESAAGTLTVQYRIDPTGFWQTATYNTFAQRYEGTTDITYLVNGSHSITARATDGSNNTTTSLVVTFVAADPSGGTGTSEAVPGTVNKPPTVDITAPRNGAVVRGSVTVTALATDDAGIAKVQFFVDGSSIGTDTNSAGGWRISWNTTRVNNGRRTLRAVATDTNGQTTAHSIIVTVDNDSVPSLTITGPGDGATIFNVGVVLISANASDDDGVEQVEFFVDGTSIGVDTIASNGWSAIWNPSRATIGSHTVRAVATDTIGQTAADSNEVTIQALTTVTTPESPEEAATAMAVETPAEGLSATAFSLAPPSLLAGGEITLTVALAANIPGKADVQFLLDGQPLGEIATVAAGTRATGVFTRSLPTGVRIGLHRVEVVTTEQPPRILASRTVGVVAGVSAASAGAAPASHSPSTSPGLILAIVVGGMAALAAAGFGAAGWFQRKMIVRRLVARSR